MLWWHEPGVEGRITVAGRRLDGPAGTLTADFEGNPTPRGQQPGGLSFSAPGCWEITGEAGGKRLTFVALVVPAPLAAQPATSGGAGDPAALGTFLTARHADLGVSRPGEEGLLHWYAVDGPAPVYARSRDEALAYFATRHARGEQLHLDEVQDAAYERGAIVAITFTLTRQADDLAIHRVIGKAAFSCAGETIVQWVMGPDPPNP